jgi:hypothetical protein
MQPTTRPKRSCELHNVEKTISKPLHLLSNLATIILGGVAMILKSAWILVIILGSKRHPGAISGVVVLVVAIATTIPFFFRTGCSKCSFRNYFRNARASR